MVIFMAARGIRLFAAALLIPILMTFLSGCWDEHELDALFIITGVALDKSIRPDQMDITMQVGKTESESSGSGDASSQGDSIILLKTTNDTMLGGIMDFNRDSSRRVLLHHNQVLLFGSALAEQGVKKRIDLFMRDQEARMEVPVMVSDGFASAVLSTKMDQDKISGLFLSRVMSGLAAVSPQYRVRMLDFASRLMDGTSSPVAPIAKVVEEDGKNEIRIAGMAVFKGDKMIGRLSNDEVLGYIWAMGDVKQSGVAAKNHLGKAVFNIAELDCKKDITLRQDGGVRVAMDVDAVLNVGELSGFEGMPPDELMPLLVELAQDEIGLKITNTFEIARRLNADIYRFGISVYRKYPKEWKIMRDHWDAIFPDIELSVRTRVRIPGTGKTVQSLEMEESMK